MFIWRIIDGTTTGDGSDEGTAGACQKQDPTRRCLSSGECRACKLIGTAYEGCDSSSTSPVCDADTGTIGIQTDYSDPSKTPACVQCKKADGKSIVCQIYYIYVSVQIKWSHIILKLSLTCGCMLVVFQKQVLQQVMGVNRENVLHPV